MPFAWNTITHPDKISPVIKPTTHFNSVNDDTNIEPRQQLKMRIVVLVTVIPLREKKLF